MAENMFCSGMKVASDEFRNNFDRIFNKIKDDDSAVHDERDFCFANFLPKSVTGKDCLTCQHGSVLPSSYPCCSCMEGCDGSFRCWEAK